MQGTGVMLTLMVGMLIECFNTFERFVDKF